MTLGYEEERLKATLAAEERRLQDQLSFQRGETDRAELRRILGALAEHISILCDAVDEAALLAARTAEEAKHPVLMRIQKSESTRS